MNGSDRYNVDVRDGLTLLHSYRGITNIRVLDGWAVLESGSETVAVIPGNYILECKKIV